MRPNATIQPIPNDVASAEALFNAMYSDARQIELASSTCKLDMDRDAEVRTSTLARCLGNLPQLVDEQIARPIDPLVAGTIVSRDDHSGPPNKRPPTRSITGLIGPKVGFQPCKTKTGEGSPHSAARASEC
jgi:hypothetical protein